MQGNLTVTLHSPSLLNPEPQSTPRHILTDIPILMHDHIPIPAPRRRHRIPPKLPHPPNGPICSSCMRTYVSSVLRCGWVSARGDLTRGNLSRAAAERTSPGRTTPLHQPLARANQVQQWQLASGARFVWRGTTTGVSVVRRCGV